MNTAVKNIFGVAAAILVLLGVNTFSDTTTLSLPESNTEVTTAEATPVATLKDFNDAIVDIAEKTNPAVVTINTQKTQEIRYADPFSMFRNPFGAPQTETQERVLRGLGSGVIVSEEGYIITNNHVINDTDEIRVRLYDGDEVEAELIGTDPETDIAVIKIDVDNLPTVKMGNSDNAQVGSFVLAIGSPLSEDLAHTVSFGIVSARSRALKNLTTYGDYIQTDAAINPGNSGGALIDMNGELVGINSAIASRSGGNDGIGFAIPVNLAKRIMDDLIEDGSVSRGYLGILPADVDQVMAMALGLDGVRGVLVSQVVEDTPADKAGLKENDIIVAIDGERFSTGDANAFRTKIASLKPGDKVTFGINRDGGEKEITVKLGERPDDLASAEKLSSSARDIDEVLGFNVTDFNNDIRRQLNIGNDVEGVVVTNIEESSKAYDRGLRKGDVITAVKRNTIENEQEFYKEIDKSMENGDKAVLLTIERNNSKQFIAFEL